MLRPLPFLVASLVTCVVVCRVLASRVQIPLMLAWAISIHKVRSASTILVDSRRCVPLIWRQRNAGVNTSTTSHIRVVFRCSL